MAEEKQEDITLDNVLSTGENNDRNNTITPDLDDSSSKKDDNKDTNNNSKTPDTTGKDNTKSDDTDSKVKVKTLLSSFTNVDDLEDNNKSIREQLLTKYQGESFDEEGNIIDKDGNILKSFDDIYTDLDSEEDVTLDDKGNQIDKDGNIVKTKAELAAEKSVINKLHKESGYEFLDENGEIKIYTDDEEGISEFTNDVAARKFEENRERFFNQHPILLEVAKHILSGNDISTFNQSVDYSKLDKSKLSTDEKLAYIRQSFEIKNLEKDRIDDIMQLIKDGNTVDADFDKAKQSLIQHNADLKKQQDIAFEKQVQEHNEKIEKHWSTVKSIIDADKTKFVNIPKEEKEAFYNYVSTAVDSDGNSQAMLDSKAQSLEEKIGLDYLRFKKFNFDSVINQRVNQKRITSLKSLINRSAGIKDDSISSGSSKTSGKDVDISISSLLG